MPGEIGERSMGDTGRPKAAVLGAGGFIGGYLTLNLTHLGFRLNLLSHKTDPGFISPRGQIETFRGSIEDEDSLAQCFDGCDTVFHLVGIIAETRTKTFQKTVIEGTARLVAAAKKTGVKKIIYLSALGTSAVAESDYHKAKWEAERQIIDSGLDYTIFRPSIVYGVGDQFINKIAGIIRMMPVVPVLGDGLYKLQPVYVEELTTLMALSAVKDYTSRKIYEIGGPEQLTYLEVLNIIKRTMSRKRASLHIPLFLARMAAYLMEMVLKPAPLTRDQLKMIAAGSTCDHMIAENEFGVKFSSLEIQLQKYMRK